MQYPRLPDLQQGTASTVRLPVLLTRAYIRHILASLGCQLADLNRQVPDIGSATGSQSERWFRWARGYCALARAYTPCNGMQVNVVDYVESLVPGSRQLVAGPLRIAAGHTWRNIQKTTKFLLLLDDSLIAPLFMLPRCFDEEGHSRFPASVDQIRHLCQFVSLDALAAIIVLYKEMGNANAAWGCISANEEIWTLVDKLAEKTPEFGEDAYLFPASVRQILEQH